MEVLSQRLVYFKTTPRVKVFTTMLPFSSNWSSVFCHSRRIARDFLWVRRKTQIYAANMEPTEADRSTLGPVYMIPLSRDKMWNNFDV